METEALKFRNVKAICVKALRTGQCEGSSYALVPLDVGEHEPYTWAVKDPKGNPVVLGFDSFEVGRWWALYETSNLSPPMAPIRLLSDADTEAREYDERCEDRNHSIEW
jgi:hypothetical protein